MNRKLLKINLIAGAMLMIAGCQLSPEEGLLAPEHSVAPMTKISNSPDISDQSTLLLHLDTELDDALVEQLKANGAVKIEKLFPSTPGKEELERQFGLDRWYEVTLAPSDKIVKAAERFAKVAKVGTVQYNNLYEKASDCITHPYKGNPQPQTKATGVFNDPMLGAQWHYINHGSANIATTAYVGGDINVEQTWKTLTAGDRDIIVAVVDEGVKHSHPDLFANMWTNEAELKGQPGVDDDGNGYVDDFYGYNFCDDGPITWNKDGDSGHGTHCAGTISAVNNNGLGVSGVAGGTGNKDGVRIMGCQIFSGNGGGSTAVVAKAFKYAADNGASIISCSFGYKGGSYTKDSAYIKANKAEVDALYYFEASKNNPVLDGSIAIFSSGNDGLPYANYPGALNDIISVSAFGPDYLPTYYTNYGPGCNITAPGGEAYLAPWVDYSALVLSTLPSEVNEGEDYGYMQGTSMACPHAAGVASLGLSYAKKLGKTYTVSQFKQMFLASARDFDTRLNGTKEYARGHNPLTLYEYRKKMGSGAIDTWLLMMKIEGIPCLQAKVGANQWIDISSYFGSSYKNLTYLGEKDGDKTYVEISDSDRASLGLAEDPYVQFGQLWIHPTKVGSGKITIRAVGGGDEVGGDDKIGGMAISQTVSVISRNVKSSTGGWL